MTNESTIEKMNKMKLHGMVRAFKASMETDFKKNYTSDEILAHLIDAEYDDRNNRKLERLLRTARLRFPASIEEIDFSKDRELNKNQILRFSDCSWIEKKENVLITGATGAGKSFFACALGNQACLCFNSVLYFNASKLFSKIKISKADGTYEKMLTKIEKTDLLIIDDFGLESLDHISRLSLLEILEDRYHKKSTIITSQIPATQWHDVIKDATIADAICDRMIHSSHKVNLKGDTLRKKYNKKPPGKKLNMKR